MPERRAHKSEIVVLGPSLDLHPGIHASLVASPPRGFQYQVRAARHLFVHDARARTFNPLTHYHCGEYASFGPGRHLVHSAWWPVLERSAWFVDLDEIPYPLFAGRTAMSARFRRQFRGPWRTHLAQHIGPRIRQMIEGYTHPSCRGVLFRTRFGVGQAIAQLDALGFGELVERLVEKSYVVRPSTAPIPMQTVRKKWNTGEPLRVLFCGRDFATKDGALALRVISRIQTNGARLNFTFIASLPPNVWREYGEALHRISVFDNPPRDVVLEEMSRSHILFHPSPNESVGMVFLEAAAAGLAVVCSEGTGLRHLDEILPRKGSLRVNRDHGSLHNQEVSFIRHLERLAAHPAEARAMGRINHAKAESGPISLLRRNEILRQIYERASVCPTTAPLTLQSLTRAKRMSLSYASSERLEEILLAHQRRQRASFGQRVFF
jgi:glycosyltransferase involved in cell wall biosynthesis